MFAALICVLVGAACVKKTVPLVQPEPLPVKTPTVKFVFVNRIGFRNDSTRHGLNDTVLAGVCLDLKYFDKKANQSFLIGTCFNRNFPEDYYPLTDSILFQEFEASAGCKYLYEVELVWKRAITLASTKNLKYNLRGYPKVDTVKLARDTVILFTWPHGTASGRFVKTYQWP